MPPNQPYNKHKPIIVDIDLPVSTSRLEFFRYFFCCAFPDVQDPHNLNAATPAPPPPPPANTPQATLRAAVAAEAARQRQQELQQQRQQDAMIKQWLRNNHSPHAYQQPYPAAAMPPPPPPRYQSQLPAYGHGHNGVQAERYIGKARYYPDHVHMQEQINLMVPGQHNDYQHLHARYGKELGERDVLIRRMTDGGYEEEYQLKGSSKKNRKENKKGNAGFENHVKACPYRNCKPRS